MKKLIFAAAMAAVMMISGCGSNDAVQPASTTNEPAVTTTTVSATTVATTALTEPEEHGTSDYVDYIWYKAKADAQTASDEELQAALDWLKSNTAEYFSTQKNMELTMYYGELLEHKYKKTGNQYEKVGWQAYKTIKYVYRGVEAFEDEVTQDNLNELIELLADVNNIV